jgi:hypothetical protein
VNGFVYLVRNRSGDPIIAYGDAGSAQDFVAAMTGLGKFGYSFDRVIYQESY